MSMTEKLYDLDAYEREFEAEVVSCEACGKGRFKVVLDRTLFFPEEGGQTPDKGTINGIPVVDVQIKDEVIFHTLECENDGPVFSAGSSVSGKIDWDHRYSNMQQHTGEHIFSGLVHSRFGYENVGFHLSDSIVTMDYNGEISPGDIDLLELEANRVISRQIPVNASYPDKETLDALEYRSKKELSGPIRIVDIPGVDTCACCAPHLHNTGEVGLLKVLDVSSHKGGVRVSILCGFRALADYGSTREELKRISRLTSAPLPETGEAVSKLKNELEKARYALVHTRMQYLECLINEVLEKKELPIIFTEETDSNILREGVNKMTALCEGFCGIFSGDEKAGYSFIIGSRDADCSLLAGKMRDHFKAKCGGKKEMIQGHIDAEMREIKRFFS